MIKFKYTTTFGTSDLFRVTFNTAFVGAENILEINRLQISPESLQKDTDKFADKFKCKFIFKDYCTLGCKSNKTPIDKLCPDCKKIMVDEIDNWLEATKIMSKHSFPS